MLETNYTQNTNKIVGERIRHCRKIKNETLEQLGEVIGTFEYRPNHKIPILGVVLAGLPMYAEKQIEGYMYTELNGGAEYFGLRVKGDSMTGGTEHFDFTAKTLICQQKTENIL